MSYWLAITVISCVLSAEMELQEKGTVEVTMMPQFISPCWQHQFMSILTSITPCHFLYFFYCVHFMIIYWLLLALLCVFYGTRKRVENWFSLTSCYKVGQLIDWGCIACCMINCRVTSRGCGCVTFPPPNIHNRGFTYRARREKKKSNQLLNSHKCTLENGCNYLCQLSPS